jgi:polyphosphate kinase 2 (PPK2 family)
MTRSENALTDRKFNLSDVDLKKSISSEEHDERLAALQKRLMAIQQTFLRTRDRGVIVFEGWDAAGKGGTIRRLSTVLDPRSLKVWPIAAPNASELGHHYLRRFWERLPGPGEIAVFDRSWYGRVLVERVEEITPEPAWSRAYDEINDFERLLAHDGVRLVKIFLHISADEQKERFADRLRDPLKRWKLSFDDFRNRARWGAYEHAIEDMVRRTSTDLAPWHVLPANDKKFGRIAAIETIVERLARGLDLTPRPLDAKLLAQAEAQLGIRASDLKR